MQLYHKSTVMSIFAPRRGFEPRITESESVVLPVTLAGITKGNLLLPLLSVIEVFCSRCVVVLPIQGLVHGMVCGLQWCSLGARNGWCQ